MDLEHFLEAGLSDPCARMHIWNNQVWQLAHGYAPLDNRTVDDYSEVDLLYLAKQHLDEFSHVGFTETVERDTRKILRELGIPQPAEVPVENATSNRPTVDTIPDTARTRLDQLTWLDNQLYEYAVKKFNPSLEPKTRE
jgi:hypothetical protein